MSCKLVIGQQPWLSLAADTWRRIDPSLDVREIEIDVNREYQFDLVKLPDDVLADTTAFVAWGPTFLNFQRFELMGELKKKGYKMPPLVSPTAVVSPSARVLENAWIQDFAFVGAASVIGFNSVIGMNARLLYQCVVDKSSWISDDVRLDSGVRVGANSVLGRGVQVAENVQIGKNVQIDNAINILSDLPDGRFNLGETRLEGQIIRLS